VGFAQGKKAKLQSFNQIGNEFSLSTKSGVNSLLKTALP